ncbi:hypothetical protein [Mesorhizobium sp. M0019]|uniref:hypothetical protein n=1 Tax=Mesorhizobium sp. M0019 TaxID=2956845 RepID=UPI00333E0ED0
MTIEQEERARIRAILGCASARKMPKLADILAIESEFTAEQAVTMPSPARPPAAGPVRSLR